MSHSIQVAVRIRPDENQGAEVIDQRTISIGSKTFQFDRIFDSGADQAKVYEEFAYMAENELKQGVNSLFAYGQTGSGKTFSMIGSREAPGIIPSLLGNLFVDKENVISNVRISFFEIYNEKIRDLLSMQHTHHKIRECGNSVQIPTLKCINAKDYETAYACLQYGIENRKQGSTAMNSSSSRSHAVFWIFYEVKEVKDGKIMSHRFSKVSLVDLAGSERIKVSQTFDDVVKGLSEKREGGNINKSLTTLGYVIKALAEKSKEENQRRPTFVPYRDSVLTWVLRDSLEGPSRTFLLAAVSPNPEHAEETLSTLRFAQSVKEIIIHDVDPDTLFLQELVREAKEIRAGMARQGGNAVLIRRLGMIDAQIEKLRNTDNAKQEEEEEESCLLRDDAKSTLEIDRLDTPIVKRVNELRIDSKMHLDHARGTPVYSREDHSETEVMSPVSLEQEVPQTPTPLHCVTKGASINEQIPTPRIQVPKVALVEIPGDREYYVYFIKVTCFGHSWWIARRFHELYQFQADSVVLGFPKKRFYPFKTKEEVADVRKGLIEDWFNNWIQVKCVQCVDIRDFLKENEFLRVRESDLFFVCTFGSNVVWAQLQKSIRQFKDLIAKH